MAGNFNTDIATVVGRDIKPSIGFRSTKQAKVLTAQFGDGYSQRTSYSINNAPIEWQVTFQNQSIADIDAIRYFLDTAGTAQYTGSYPSATRTVNGDPSKMGVTYFLWTPPNESTQYKIICASYDVEYSSSITRTLTAKFTQVFDL